MNAKPIDLITSEGKTHLSGADIEHRKRNEIAFGGESLVCPAFVAADTVAKLKWDELVEKYSGQRFVSSADEGHLARYCMLYAEYQDLLVHRARVANIDFTSFEMEEIIEEMKAKIGKVAAKRMWKKVEYILSVDGILSIDKAINAKACVLTQMEDRLFLNPLAKIKNVPKRQKEPEKDAVDQELDSI
jgi:phage terminase small subunit